MNNKLGIALIETNEKYQGLFMITDNRGFKTTNEASLEEVNMLVLFTFRKQYK